MPQGQGRYIYRPEDFLQMAAPAYENLVGMIQDQTQRIQRNQQMRMEQQMRQEDRQFELALARERMQVQMGQHEDRMELQAQAQEIQREQMQQDAAFREADLGLRWAQFRSQMLQDGREQEMQQMEHFAEQQQNRMQSVVDEWDDKGIIDFVGQANINIPRNVQVIPDADGQFKMSVGGMNAPYLPGADAQGNVPVEELERSGWFEAMQEFSSFVGNAPGIAADSVNDMFKKLEKHPSRRAFAAPIDEDADTIDRWTGGSEAPAFLRRTEDGRFTPEAGNVFIDGEGRMHFDRDFMRNEVRQFVNNQTNPQAQRRFQNFMREVQNGNVVPITEAEGEGHGQMMSSDFRNKMMQIHEDEEGMYRQISGFLGRDIAEKVVENADVAMPNLRRHDNYAGTERQIRSKTLGEMSTASLNMIALLREQVEGDEFRKDVVQDDLRGMVERYVNNTREIARRALDDGRVQGQRELEEAGYSPQQVMQYIQIDPAAEDYSQAFTLPDDIVEQAKQGEIKQYESWLTETGRMPTPREWDGPTGYPAMLDFVMDIEDDEAKGVLFPLVTPPTTF